MVSQLKRDRLGYCAQCLGKWFKVCCVIKASCKHLQSLLELITSFADCGRQIHADKTQRQQSILSTLFQNLERVFVSVVTQLQCSYRADVVLGCITGKPAQLISEAREIVQRFQKNEEHIPYFRVGANVPFEQWWRVLGTSYQFKGSSLGLPSAVASRFYLKDQQ